MDDTGHDNFAVNVDEKQIPVNSNSFDTNKITSKEDFQENNVKEGYIFAVRNTVSRKLNQNPVLKKLIISVIGHALVMSYVVAAVIHWQNTGSKPLKVYDGLGLLLIILSIFYWSLIYYKLLKPIYRCWDNTSCGKFDSVMSVLSSLGSKLFYILPPILFAVFLIYDTRNDRRRLISLVGVTFIIMFGFLFSKYPSRVNWSIIYRGIFIQVVMAMLTVRWSVGKEILLHLGNKIETFLSFSYVGASFVYGENLIYQQAVFAFQCLSVIFFVNFVVEVLFYYQVLQITFLKFGWFLQKALGTTVIESINCCVSVVLGVNEAMLVIKSHMNELTMSELQAVLLGELSTVAGSVFAAYVSFGVNPGYLVTASLMSAPAALSLSKLLYPETEVSKTKAEIIKIDKSYKELYTNAISAGCHGAMVAVPIVANIIASLVAFISLLAFGNSVLSWFGELIGYESLTIEFILAKILIPVAYLIGIDPDQCEIVGELIATKAIVNEFVAYQKLGAYKKQNLLSARSEAIATYALCSFSNPGSVAGMLAIVSTICKPQLENATKLAFRAYIGGIVTCFITASIAGLLTPTTGNLNNLMQMTNATVGV